MHKKILSVLVFFIFIASTLTGQINYFSLASKQGIGDVLRQGVIPQQSMGYLGATYYSPYNVNYANPASYGYLSMASFDIGLNVQNIDLDFASEKKKFLTGGLDYISVAVPLINPLNRILDKKTQDFQIGMVIGLRPYSKVGYRSDAVDSVSVADDYRKYVEQFQGTGGTYMFTTGVGAKYKDFSLGINLNYLYGKIKDEQVLWLPVNTDYGVAYSDHFFRIRDFKGWHIEMGSMYDYYLKRNPDNPAKSKKITLGVSGRWTQKMNITEEEKYYKRDYDVQGIEQGELRIENSDTIYERSVTNKWTIPSVLNVGLMYHHENKLKIGANWDLESWSKLKHDDCATCEVSFDGYSRLKNSSVFSLGAEYTPDETSYNSLWKRMKYRGGFFVGNDYRVRDDKQASTWGLETGVGIPIFQARQISFINIGASYRNLELGNLSENYLTFKFGLTFNNNLWFYRRRFD